MNRKDHLIIYFLTSLILLFLANLVLQPVPLPAGLAVLGGLSAWAFGKRRHGIGLGMLLGVLGGVAWHGYQHVTGQSTEPEEGFVWHLVRDGLIGYGIALLILGLVIGFNLLKKRLSKE